MGELAEPRSKQGFKVGFVGLGVMGSRIAERIALAGYEVVAHDADPSAYATHGGELRVGSIEEACGGARAVFLSLPNGQIVKDVLFGDPGVVSCTPSGAVIVDVSTIGPGWAGDISADLRSATFVDAPVGGGWQEAENGALISLVGGPADAVALVKPILSSYSSRVVHFGGTGAGQAAKVALNMSQAVMTVGAAEAALLCEQLGVDLVTFLETLESLDANPWFQRPLRHYLQGDYPLGFRTSLALKDVGLAVDAARDHGVSVLAGELAQQVLTRTVESGYADEHFSALIKTIKEATATQPGNREKE